MKIFFIRHGETHWNKLKKYQGHTDIRLSENGIQQVTQWLLPNDINHWYISPLSRTIETADIHQLTPRTIVPELIEANWGEWEGLTIGEIRQQHAEALASQLGLGLDLTPPGGESPRQVRLRLSQWLNQLKPSERIGAITHRGVIRAALSLATDWDMKSDHEVDIRHNYAYEFELHGNKLEYLRAHKMLV